MTTTAITCGKGHAHMTETMASVCDATCDGTRHEFHLTRSYVGRETGATFYVGTCTCGATETTVGR